MAIFHLNVRVVSRGQNQFAADALGYISGEQLVRPNGNKIPRHLVGRRADEIVGVGAIGWSGNLQALSNAVETSERRCDASLGRRIIVALPSELDDSAREKLVRGFALKLRDKHGCAVAFAIHRPSESGDHRNHHAHLFVTERAVNGSSEFAAKKIGEFNVARGGRATVDFWRSEWEKRTNAALEKAGVATRISAASHQANGIPLTPTKHIGLRATAAERKGKNYKYGNTESNRRIVDADQPLVAARDIAARARAGRRKRRARAHDQHLGLRGRRFSGAELGVQNLERSGPDNDRRDPLPTVSPRSRRDDQSNAPQLSLTLLKSIVPLDRLAGVNGWSTDLSGGKGETIQMRQTDGGREIVISRGDAGHWQYFRRDGTSAGTIVDFVQKELGWGDLGEVRRRLSEIALQILPTAPARHFSSRLPIRAAARRVRKSDAIASPQIAANKMTAREYLRARGLHDETLEHFSGSWNEGPHAVAQFPHKWAKGSGYEYRGPSARGFSSGGQKGMWMHRTGANERTVVVAESAIDCMSHAQAHGLPDATIYLSAGGGFGPYIIALVIAVVAKIGARLVAAFDNDEAGERMAAQLRSAAEAANIGDRFIRDIPEHGKDWNEFLIVRSVGSEMASPENEEPDEEEGMKL